MSSPSPIGAGGTSPIESIVRSLAANEDIRSLSARGVAEEKITELAGKITGFLAENRAASFDPATIVVHVAAAKQSGTPSPAIEVEVHFNIDGKSVTNNFSVVRNDLPIRMRLLEALKKDPLQLERMGAVMRDDKVAVMTAVSAKGQALAFASDRLKNDKEVVEAACRQDAGAIISASAELQEYFKGRF